MLFCDKWGIEGNLTLVSSSAKEWTKTNLSACLRILSEKKILTTVLEKGTN